MMHNIKVIAQDIGLGPVVRIPDLYHKGDTQILHRVCTTRAGKLEPHIVSIGSTIGDTVDRCIFLCTVHCFQVQAYNQRST